MQHQISISEPALLINNKRLALTELLSTVVQCAQSVTIMLKEFFFRTHPHTQKMSAQVHTEAVSNSHSQARKKNLKQNFKILKLNLKTRVY